jgi:hypothetical protein
MAVPPLSHHQLIELVEPFVRQGLRIDLAASDRLQRRLLFHSVDLPGEPAVRQSLQLDGSGTDWWQLTCTLLPIDRPDAPPARVVSSGTRPGELLAAVQSISAERCFRFGDGFSLARSSWLAPGPSARPTLTGGSAQIGKLRLELSVPATTGVSASIVLEAASSPPPELPQDLLAVLGWNWAPLMRSGVSLWKSRVRLSRRGPARTTDAERALDRVAEHLAHTLAEAPGRFHDRHRRARWGVVLRRALPTLTALSLLVTVAMLPRLGLDKIEGAWTLLYHVPTLLLALAFMLQEMPRFEIPPWPRRSRATDWCGATTARPARQRQRPEEAR